jgi:hypothetical protein
MAEMQIKPNMELEANKQVQLKELLQTLNWKLINETR